MADRLTALDTSFLHLEDDSAHMHVASVMLFDGDPPPHDELIAGIESRLHLVPRYRQKLAFVPFGQGRPRWVDDPHLNLSYHVRKTALPAPGTEEQLRALAGRVLAQQLDRDKPLWEIWVVEGVEGGRFALICKTHHALVDGISGVDIVTVLFDLAPEGREPDEPERRWLPAPAPSRTQLLSEALLERAIVPGEIARSVRAVFRTPRQIASGALDSLVGVGAMAWAGVNAAPPSPYNCKIGPHRRFTWVRTNLADVKAIKDSLGGTVNDVVLATVSGALGRHLHRRGETLSGRELKAMVPVSVRADEDRGALGNQVAAMMAPLPVWCEDPGRRLEIVNEAMAGLKDSGQAVGAQVLTQLTGFAPADDHGSGVAPDGAPADVQPGRHERARPAVPALPDGTRAARPVPDGAARTEPGPRGRDHELQREDELRPGRRLRRHARPGRPCGRFPRVAGRPGRRGRGLDHERARPAHAVSQPRDGVELPLRECARRSGTPPASLDST